MVWIQGRGLPDVVPPFTLEARGLFPLLATGLSSLALDSRDTFDTLALAIGARGPVPWRAS